MFLCSLVAIGTTTATTTRVLSDPLQGRVEEKGTGSLKNDLEAKLDQMELEGGAQGNGLRGGVQGNGLQGGVQGNGLQGGVQQTGLNGQADANGPLQATASMGGPMSAGIGNDPDGTDQQLQIDWDRWRNTLTQAIQAGTINKINIHNDQNFVIDPRRNMMVSRFPEGISTQYSCDVLPNGRIINIRLMQSSGYQAYDQAVMQSIFDLQGSPILRYPGNSHRQIVNQQASVISSMHSNFKNFKFGDVETQRR